MVGFRGGDSRLVSASAPIFEGRDTVRRASVGCWEMMS